MLSALLPVLLFVVLSIMVLAADVLMGSPAGFVHMGESGSLARALIVGGSLISGIYSKALYEEMERQPENRFSLMRALRRSARSRSLWTALLLAPIVLLAFYPTLAEVDNRWLLALFAYENGFFFRTIFERRERDLRGEHA